MAKHNIFIYWNAFYLFDWHFIATLALPSFSLEVTGQREQHNHRQLQ